MVYSGIATFDPHPFDSIKNKLSRRSLGEIHEDWSYGRLSKDFEN
jgi:hypothetical protein